MSLACQSYCDAGTRRGFERSEPHGGTRNAKCHSRRRSKTGRGGERKRVVASAAAFLLLAAAFFIALPGPSAGATDGGDNPHEHVPCDGSHHHGGSNDHDSEDGGDFSEGNGEGETAGVGATDGGDDPHEHVPCDGSHHHDGSNDHDSEDGGEGVCEGNGEGDRRGHGHDHVTSALAENIDWHDHQRQRGRRRADRPGHHEERRRPHQGRRRRHLRLHPHCSQHRDE